VKRITFARALPGYRLRLRYDDGVEGAVDLSADVGKGVFSLWCDPEAFARFRVSEDGRSVIWSEAVDACADALYLTLTGLAPEDLFPALKQTPSYA
jgi:hypothetical protein